MAPVVPSQFAFVFTRGRAFVFVFETVQHLFGKGHRGAGRIFNRLFACHRLMTLLKPTGQCGRIFIGRRCAARHHLFGIV